MKIFFIIYSILYLLLEIAFRSRLLETIGVVSDTSSIENIETLGRLISSLGFAIILASLVKVKKAPVFLKIITFVMVYSLSFGGFFVAQKYMVDSIVDSVPSEVKEKAFYLQLYKENVYYGKMYSKNFPYTIENKDTSQSKVFLANLPLLNIDNTRYIDVLIKNKSSLIDNSVEYGVDASSEAILSDWLDATGKLNGSYDKFKKAQDKAHKKIKSINKDAEEAFKMIEYYKKEEFRGYRNYILSIYATGNYLSAGNTNRGLDYRVGTKDSTAIFDRSSMYNSIRYDNKGTLFVKNDTKQSLIFNQYGVHPRYSLRKSAIDFNEDNITTKESLNAFMNAFENSMVARIYEPLKFKLKLIDGKLGYKYSDTVLNRLNDLKANVCKKYRYNVDVMEAYPNIGVHRGINNKIYVLSDGKYEMSYNASFEALDNNNFMICSFDSKTSQFKLILMDIANKFNKAKFGFDRDYSRSSGFYKTKYFREILQKELKHKKMEVPLNFNSGSYSQFKKYYTKSVNENVIKTLTQIVVTITGINYREYTNKYGYVRLDTNEKQLFELPAIKNKLKERVPFLYDKNGKFVHRYRTIEFNSSSSLDKLPTVKDNFAREQKIFLTAFAKDPVAKTNTLDNYGKALVVPPFVLLVSTIMIIVNLVNLFWRFIPIKNSKTQIAINGLFFAFIAMIPLLFSNSYVETKYYERLVKSGTPESYILTTVWLQNTNVLFEKSYVVGQIFEPLIDLFEHNVLLHDTVGGASEIRKISLREKLKNTL